MAMKEQNFEMWAGESIRIFFKIEGFEHINEVADIEWKLRELPESDTDIIFKKLNVNDGIVKSGDYAVITFDSTDTINLSGTYHHEARAVDKNDRAATVFIGRAKINRSMFAGDQDG